MNTKFIIYKNYIINIPNSIYEGDIPKCIVDKMVIHAVTLNSEKIPYDICFLKQVSMNGYNQTQIIDILNFLSLLVITH
jgi:hypothetical protein